jgi:hypothetical protein
MDRGPVRISDLQLVGLLFCLTLTVPQELQAASQYFMIFP